MNHKQLWEVSAETREGRIEGQAAGPTREAAINQFKAMKRLREETDPVPTTPFARPLVANRFLAIQL